METLLALYVFVVLIGGPFALFAYFIAEDVVRQRAWDEYDRKWMRDNAHWYGSDE